MSYGAIQTEYAGHLFRSRLEARWAVFFDFLNIAWKYESQGFESKSGARYLPDFYLPKTDTWVEVKGDPEGMHKDWPRMCQVLDGDSPLSGMKDSRHTSRGLVLLGDIPAPRSSGVYLHRVVQHSEGLQCAWGTFLPQMDSGTGGRFYCIGDPGSLGEMLGVRDELGIEANSACPDISPKHLDIQFTISRQLPAYDAARKARFEHGESGWRR